jgi:hypothetical protein
MVKSPERTKQIGKSRSKNNLYLVVTLASVAIVTVGVSVPLEQSYAMLCEDCDGENTAWNREDSRDPRNTGDGTVQRYPGFDSNTYGGFPSSP